MAGLAYSVDADGTGALLSNGHIDNGTTVCQRIGHTTPLIEGEVSGNIWTFLDQPVHAHVGRAVLLIGHDHQEKVTTTPPALTCQ